MAITSLALALQAHEEALAIAGVAQLGAEAEREVLAGVGAEPTAAGAACALGAGRVQHGQLGFRDLEEEARRLAHPIPLDAAVQGIGEEESLLGAGDAHVAEAPLLFELVRVVHRARVREHALLQPREEYHGKLESLGGVERHQGDAARLVIHLVDVRHERDGIEEGLDLHVGRAERFLIGDEFLGGGDELLEVLEPRGPLGRAVGAERVLVAGGGDDLVDEGGNGSRRAALGEPRDQAGKVLERLPRLGRRSPAEDGRTRRAGTRRSRARARPGGRAWLGRHRGSAPPPRAGTPRRRRGSR